VSHSPVADAFEQNRPRLMSLAYRMLGEIQAAEDIVQEGWLAGLRRPRGASMPRQRG
jgi:RNA polymerase sigma-70 factor (ECF subfamily)